MSAVIFVVGAVLMLVIYVWSIVLAYELSGIIAACATVIMPFIGQAYWFFYTGFKFGFSNPYCVAVIAYAVIVGAGFMKDGR